MQTLRQAMVLSAGLSTRMRPLTNDIPKPLVPFLGKRIMDFTFEYLRANGIETISVNVFHGREPFLKALKAPNQPLKIQVFEENPIFGTGGGIKNMKPFVSDEHFAVVNCDFFTDVDLRAAYQFHLSKKAIATMLLIENENAKRYGEIGIDEIGRIVKFPYGKPSGKPVKAGLFSGIHIFHRSIFDHMPNEQVFDINRDVYASLVEKKASVYGYLTASRWIDAGELELFRRAQEELRAKPMKWMGP